MENIYNLVAQIKSILDTQVKNLEDIKLKQQEAIQKLYKDHETFLEKHTLEHNLQMKRIEKEIEENSKYMSSKRELSYSSRVVFNVGGKVFKTTLGTLLSCTDVWQVDTLFSVLFRRLELEKITRGEGKNIWYEIFIDRDGHLFREILNFLRNMEAPTLDPCSKFVEEAVYYGLEQILFGWKQDEEFQHSVTISLPINLHIVSHDEEDVQQIDTNLCSESGSIQNLVQTFFSECKKLERSWNEKRQRIENQLGQQKKNFLYELNLKERKLLQEKQSVLENKKRLEILYERAKEILEIQDKKVPLNVGGKKFATTLHTLTKYPDSMLTALFLGNFSKSKDEDGHYFIDRDGKTFRHILSFLRLPTRSYQNRIHPEKTALRAFMMEMIEKSKSDEHLMRKLKREAEYFQLKPMLNAINNDEAYRQILRLGPPPNLSNVVFTPIYLNTGIVKQPDRWKDVHSRYVSAFVMPNHM